MTGHLQTGKMGYVYSFPATFPPALTHIPMNAPTVARPAPKIGLLINSIGVFNREAKDDSEKAIRQLFSQWLSAGQIAADSIITERIFGPHEALAVADRFAAACVDLVVIANVAFPNGQVFLTIATHPHLRQTPLAVIAEPEPVSPEWATNAWCGVIMNNHVAKEIGRSILTLPGPFNGDEFQTAFARLLRVAGTIGFLRRDLMCRFGEPPAASTPPPATNSPSPRCSARGWIRSI